MSDTPRQFSPDDSREVRELKQIVNGMREELREYLANGNGTPRSATSDCAPFPRRRRESRKWIREPALGNAHLPEGFVAGIDSTTIYSSNSATGW